MFENVGRIEVTRIDATTIKPLSTHLERGRIGITVKNTDNKDVFIGGANVTSENGCPLKAGEVFEIGVNNSAHKNLFVIGGTITLVEYYQ